jgi:hypothetical protein
MVAVLPLHAKQEATKRMEAAGIEPAFVRLGRDRRLQV